MNVQLKRRSIGDWMKTIRDWMQEYLEAMIKQFESHNDHPEYQNDFSLDGEFDALKHTDLDTLRFEKHTHYAKWIYHGLHKKTYPEQDALINDSNVNFLLWVRLQIGNKKATSC